MFAMYVSCMSILRPLLVFLPVALAHSTVLQGRLQPYFLSVSPFMHRLCTPLGISPVFGCAFCVYLCNIHAYMQSLFRVFLKNFGAFLAFSENFYRENPFARYLPHTTNIPPPHPHNRGTRQRAPPDRPSYQVDRKKKNGYFFIRSSFLSLLFSFSFSVPSSFQVGGGSIPIIPIIGIVADISKR